MGYADQMQLGEIKANSPLEERKKSISNVGGHLRNNASHTMKQINKGRKKSLRGRVRTVKSKSLIEDVIEEKSEYSDNDQKDNNAENASG